MSKKTKRILLLGCLALLLGCVLLLSRHLANWRDTGFPKMEITLNKTRRRGRQLHTVGANFAYETEEGELELYRIPSLQGLWQLDEAYSQSMIRLDADTEYLEIFCADGRWKQPPHSLQIFRFPLALAEAEPGSVPDYSQGTELSVSRRGNYYRLDDILPNAVYVVRTVWDGGVLENGWILLEK